eukprot:975165-Rhodomonas_salina.1
MKQLLDCPCRFENKLDYVSADDPQQYPNRSKSDEKPAVLDVVCHVLYRVAGRGANAFGCILKQAIHDWNNPVRP